MDGMNVDTMIVCAVIGSLIMLVGGFVVLSSVMKMQTPTLGIYIMLIGIIITFAGPLSIMIFENIKIWIR